MTGSPQLELHVTTESPSRCRRILTIEFARQHFDAERQRIARELRKRVVRPGFRKGKVPLEVLEKEFAARIEADALESLIPSVCSQAIEQEHLDVISTPNVKSLDLEHPERVRMDVELDVRPQIFLAPLSELHAERWMPEVFDSDLHEAMERLRNQQAQFVSVERPAADGDYVRVGYIPLDEHGREQPAKKVENYSFLLGAGQVVEEFERAVRGKVVRDVGHAEVRYADDHEDPELAGKRVAFVLTLDEVKEKRLPDLDDEFAKDLDLESLDTLRARLRDDLLHDVEKTAEQDVCERLVDALIQANPFETPQSMVDNSARAVLADYEQRYRSLRLQLSEEQRASLLQSARSGAERAVRRHLLLDAVRKQHDVKLLEEDVDSWIEHKVQAGGAEGPRIRKFFAEPDNRRRLRGELLETKVLELVKSQAVIRDVPRPKPEPGVGSER